MTRVWIHAAALAALGAPTWAAVAAPIVLPGLVLGGLVAALGGRVRRPRGRPSTWYWRWWWWYGYRGLYLLDWSTRPTRAG